MGVNPIRPFVSILLPVHNAEATLTECVESIRQQTFSDFEVIVVNDASSDASLELLNRWAFEDVRVRVINQSGHLRGDCGLVTALNLGLHHASGNVIARMDADDVMHPQRLQKQADFLRFHQDIDLVATQVELFSSTELQAGYIEYIRWQNTVLTPEDIKNEIYIESPFAHPSVMFRKQCVSQLGGYHAGDFPEDYDLWLRMVQAGYRMAKLPEILLQWRESGSRASRVDQRYSREAFDRLRAQYLSMDSRINDDRPIVYWGAGRKTRKRSGRLVEMGFKPCMWIDIDHRKIGNRLDGVSIAAPSWLQEQQGTDKPFVLSYVSNHGARELIADQLQQYGYEKGVDYLLVG